MVEAEEARLFAFLAYILPPVGLIISWVVKKDDEFVMFHVAQSIVLFIAFIVIFVAAITSIILIGLVLWAVGVLFVFILLVFILWIMGIINALTGKQKTLPLIGGFGEKLKL